jgi:hypothetical protein
MGQKTGKTGKETLLVGLEPAELGGERSCAATH